MIKYGRRELDWWTHQKVFKIWPLAFHYYSSLWEGPEKLSGHQMKLSRLMSELSVRKKEQSNRVYPWSALLYQSWLPVWPTNTESGKTIKLMFSRVIFQILEMGLHVRRKDGKFHTPLVLMCTDTARVNLWSTYNHWPLSSTRNVWNSHLISLWSTEFQ